MMQYLVRTAIGMVIDVIVTIQMTIGLIINKISNMFSYGETNNYVEEPIVVISKGKVKTNHIAPRLVYGNGKRKSNKRLDSEENETVAAKIAKQQAIIVSKQASKNVTITFNTDMLDTPHSAIHDKLSLGTTQIVERYGAIRLHTEAITPDGKSAGIVSFAINNAKSAYSEYTWYGINAYVACTNKHTLATAQPIKMARSMLLLTTDKFGSTPSISVDVLRQSNTITRQGNVQHWIAVHMGFADNRNYTGRVLYHNAMLYMVTSYKQVENTMSTLMMAIAINNGLAGYSVVW